VGADYRLAHLRLKLPDRFRPDRSHPDDRL
jgi:hypothetical protein